jgi:O-antigen/teichoic acid export membrane protein
MIGFVMIPVYTRFLSPADYGVLELLTLVTIVLAMVLSFRLESAMVRYYAEYPDVRERHKLVSTVLIFMIGVATLTAWVLSMNSGLVSRLVIGDEKYSHFFIFIFVTLAFELCATIGNTYLKILEKSLHFIAISLLQLLLGLSFNIYFVVALKLGVQGILYSMVIANGAAALILLAYTLRHTGFHFEIQKLRLMMAFGLPFIPAGFLIFVLNMGDRYILNRLGNLSEVGIYALGYKFGMLLSAFLAQPFQSIWGPKRIEIFRNRDNRNEIFTRVFTYLLFGLFFAGLAISLLIKDVLMIMAAPEFWPAYRVVPFVILGYIFYNLYYFVDFGFYINNKTYWYPVINAVAAGANVGLNILLIPEFGAVGAAIVTAISFLICPLMAFAVSQRLYYIPYDFARILKLLLVVVACYFLGVLISTGHRFIDVTIKLMIVFSCPLFLHALGFFDSKEVVFIKTRLRERFGFFAAPSRMAKSL